MDAYHDYHFLLNHQCVQHMKYIVLVNLPPSTHPCRFTSSHIMPCRFSRQRFWTLVSASHFSRWPSTQIGRFRACSPISNSEWSLYLWSCHSLVSCSWVVAWSQPLFDSRRCLVGRLHIFWNGDRDATFSWTVGYRSTIQDLSETWYAYSRDVACCPSLAAL